jgi:hypothetical protein
MAMVHFCPKFPTNLPNTAPEALLSSATLLMLRDVPACAYPRQRFAVALAGADA